MLRILVVIGHYLPGYKGGGPIRALANLVENLGQEFQFYILTNDRDTNDEAPYAGIQPGVWQTVGNAQVLYLSQAERSLLTWKNVLTRQDFDLLYLNSFFLPQNIYSMFLRGTHRIPDVPVIVAPRGEFAGGALSLKQHKKRAYVTFARFSGWYHGITWQATADHEQQDILSIFGSHAQVCLAPDLPSRLDTGHFAPPTKEPGSARIVFLSRIARVKNLDFALRTLMHVAGKIEFDIYGSLEDTAYWEECQSLIRQLPANIVVSYKGAIPHHEVQRTLSQYHLFYLPTLGENFGHVIFEALGAACPALISDQTLWQDLELHHAGWQAPLSKPEMFAAVLKQVLDMDSMTFEHYAQAAQRYAHDYAARSDLVAASRSLFYEAMKLKHATK